MSGLVAGAWRLTLRGNCQLQLSNEPIAVRTPGAEKVELPIERTEYNPTASGRYPWRRVTANTSIDVQLHISLQINPLQSGYGLPKQQYMTVLNHDVAP